LDHSAVLATVERIFGLRSLLDRDGLGPDVNNLMTLKTARTDAPMTLAASRIAAPMTLNAAAESAGRVRARDRIAHAVARTPDALLAADTDGTIASLLHCAVVQHLQMVTPDDKAATLARAQRLTTHADAVAYLKEVSALVGAERANHRRLIAQVRDASPLAHTGELR
jgi:phospholipase C